MVDLRHETSNEARKFATTPGTRDVLPPEAARLRAVQATIRERFRRFGYREVITPVVEYSEVIQEPKLRDAGFKLFDPENQMLLLRPEMTTPIARLVAQRLSNLPTPHKLSYVLSAYRRAGVGRGQSSELYQAGVEAVGSDDPHEDAEVIALLIDVLRSAGLADFSVALGQREFFGGYLDHVAPEAAPELLRALEAKDLVLVDRLSESLPEEVAAGVRRIPRLVGPATDDSLLAAAERYAVEASAGAAVEALSNLRRVLEYLEAYGCRERVVLDFGLIGRLGYYTGTVFEAYAARLGFTLAGGGRYDGLLGRFGRQLPATGFAISLERLLSVLPEPPAEQALVLVADGPDGVRLAAELRGRGVAVLHLCERLSESEAAEYARAVDAGWFAFPDPDSINGTGLSLRLHRTPEGPHASPAPPTTVPVEEVPRLVVE